MYCTNDSDEACDRYVEWNHHEDENEPWENRAEELRMFDYDADVLYVDGLAIGELIKELRQADLAFAACDVIDIGVVQQLFGGWLAMLQSHRGAVIMTYHKSWPYFAKRFGFQVAGYIEPKPGIPPSPSHLLHIIQTAKTKGVRVILMEPWLDKKPATLVAGKTGAEVIAATLSGTSPGTPYSYLTAMEGLVNRLAAGLSTLP